MDDQTPSQVRAPAPRAGRRSAAHLVLSRRSGHGVAHRRAATGRDRPRRNGPSGRLTRILVSLLAVVLIGSIALVGVAAVGTVAAVTALSQDLPDPTNLSALTFSQPTTVYDRTGKVQLGRFQREQRRVVAYDEVPRLVLDATTTAEDRSFWENSGFDPAAIISAVGDQVAGTSERGASTITQQLVRARLLPDDVIAPGADRYLRKAKELIQSSRLTTAFPGEEGKERIITAYLNEIFYGHDAYGVAAAARIYFGVTDLAKLTAAQAALLAGLPKSPSTFDPYRYAEPDAEGRLVVPADAPPVVRRDYILNHLSTSRWTTLTSAFPGEEGKERIITAYLNEIFYGHDAYGVAAAARIYFGVTDLAKLTFAQAALLAGLPKSPSNFDPYRYAVADADGRLVVPPDAPPVVRRNYILSNLSTSRWTTLTKAELGAALDEPVVLVGDVPLSFRAPHFTWQVRRQLQAILGPDVTIETGGYTVITTLDWKAEALAEKWLAASAIAPNLKTKASASLLKSLKIGAADRRWINALRGKDLHNAALVAIDYRTGDVLAYAGSAGYYQDKLASRKFEPKYDAAGDGARQPGSAFKPIVYASAFDAKKLSPGSLLLDITTEFGKGWTPRDADQLDRGPVLVRKALQYSLNVPAIRALGRVGSEAVAARAGKFGIRFTGGTKGFLQAGLAGAIGTVEVRPIDLTSAYGALANGGVRVAARMILEVRDATGSPIYRAPKPAGTRAVSTQAAYLVTDILSGNTKPAQNPIWSAALELRNGPKGQHRPAAVKTGTANDARDLATYGYLAPPRDVDAPAYAVGIWMGNSDHSNPKSAKPATSLTAAAPLWRAFVRDLTAKQPIADFARPKGVVRATIDAWTGGKPGPWTRDTVSEWFISGTQPGAGRAIDPPGLLYTRSCGGWRVDPLKAELGPRAWDDDVSNWLSRARRGVGVVGPYESRTAYFWERSDWGGPLLGPCAPRPQPKPDEPPKPPKDPGDPGGGGKPRPTPAPTLPPAP